MDKFQFYKDHYFFELEIKERLTKGLAIPIGLITVLVTAIAFYFREFQYQCSNIFNLLIFSTSSLISFVLIIASIYYLKKSYHDYEYEYLPGFKKIRSYENDCKNFENDLNIFNKTIGKEKSVSQSNTFEEYLTEKYSQAIDFNASRNKIKTEIF